MSSLVQDLFKDVENGNVKLVEALLLKGADEYINDKLNDETILHFVSKNTFTVDITIRQMMITEFLKLPNIKIDETDRFGHTALHFASMCGYKEIVQELIKHGANIKATTIDGATPLFYASDFGYLAVVELLTKGSDINQRGPKSRTAIMKAAQSDRYQVFEHLFCHGANVGLQDYFGYNAFHLGYMIKNYDVNVDTRVGSKIDTKYEKYKTLFQDFGKTVFELINDKYTRELFLGYKGVIVEIESIKGKRNSKKI